MGKVRKKNVTKFKLIHSSSSLDLDYIAHKRSIYSFEVYCSDTCGMTQLDYMNIFSFTIRIDRESKIFILKLVTIE